MRESGRNTELKRTGKPLKLTGLREDVLRILSDKKIPCGAYEILNELKLKRERAEPITVYRTLKFLTEHNIVHRIEAQKKYILCCHPERGICQLFICKKCCAKLELHSREVDEHIKSILSETGFELSTTSMEFYGYCKKCKSK